MAQFLSGIIFLLVSLTSATEIVVDDKSPGCRLEGNWADNLGDNPEGKSFSSAGTVGGKYLYTSKHGRWKRTGREKAYFTPDLPKAGKYKVEVSYRASENRSPRVEWEVSHASGKKRSMVNQRGDGLVWHNLGTFEFEAGKKGYAAMVSDGGESACVDAARFTLVNPGTGNPSNPMEEVIGGTPVTPATPETTEKPSQTLNISKGRDSEHTFSKDGKAVVRIGLMTYGKASALVEIIKADGSSQKWLSWERENDSDPSPLLVNGTPHEESIFEEKAGDPSARVVTVETSVNASDTIRASLKGSFGRANPMLRVRIFE
ncbi:MAG: hypothetical protein H3C47_03315 [Candidatus Cloacimonetes bacterium]|nr:hypothetical protein [Candidatus Cloacimonadota bacterium]